MSTSSDMSTSSGYLNTDGKNSDRHEEPIEDLLVELYNTPPFDIERKAYVELVFVIADRLGGPEDENGEEGRIKSDEIYDRLSSHTRREIKNSGGVTNLASAPSVLTIEPEDKNDDSDWYSLPTKYALGPLTVEAHRRLRELDATPEKIAEMAKNAAEYGDITDLRRRADEQVSRLHEQSNRLPDRAERQARGRDKAGKQAPDPGDGNARLEPALPTPDAGTPPEETPAVDTNRLEKGSATPSVNRDSERSDGESDVDEDVAYPTESNDFKKTGTRRQRRYLDARVESRPERLAFLHLLNNARGSRYSTGESADRWVAMPHRKLHDRFGASYPTESVWRDSKLIEARHGGAYFPSNVTEGKGRARELRVKEAVLEKWAELGVKGDSPRWRLDTRMPTRTSEPSPLSTDLSEGGHGYPDLVDQALRILTEAPHRMRLSAIEEAEKALLRREGAAAREQLTQLRLAKETIKRQTVKAEEGIVWIQNAYEVQELSGRLQFKLGGPQGLQKAVKQFAYRLPHLRNYDIKSCHTAALREVAETLGTFGIDIGKSPLDTYAGKYVVAKEYKLSATLVKIAEHAVKYGAVLPKSLAQARYFEKETGFYPQIADAAKKHAQRPDEALEKLDEIFCEFRAMVISIAEALLGRYYNEVQSGGYMHNACGISFQPASYEEGHERRSKVMAWMLQGLEAAFVHSITVLGTEYDYNVLANEHDGAIVEGTVPDETIRRSRQRSGFTRADFVQKPFADENEIEDVYGAGSNLVAES